MKKLVNGELIDMTTAEITATQAEQQASDLLEQQQGYVAHRQAKYPGVVAFMEAYFEKEYEARPEKMDALQQERLAVKAQFPKPV